MMELKSECNYIDDKKNGLYKEYYSNGELKSECNYIDDKKNGLYKKYYIDRLWWHECFYINDKKNGLYKLYYNSGKLIYLSYDINNDEYYLKYDRNKFSIMI